MKECSLFSVCKKGSYLYLKVEIVAFFLFDLKT